MLHAKMLAEGFNPDSMSGDTDALTMNYEEEMAGYQAALAASPASGYVLVSRELVDGMICVLRVAQMPRGDDPGLGRVEGWKLSDMQDRLSAALDPERNGNG